MTIGRVSSQVTITGRCTNSAGAGIDYVSIGIRNTFVSTVSDESGDFSITIPDSMRGRSLTFLHISYEEHIVPISELERNVAEARTSNEKFPVLMNEKIYEIEDVVVSGKQQSLKMVNLNAKGKWLGGRAIYDKSRKYSRRFSVGTIVKLKKPTWIRQLEFEIDRNTSDTLVLRVDLYKLEDGALKVLMTKPYYVYPVKSDEQQSFLCELSDQNIVTQGDVYVGLESVKIDKDGIVEIPTRWGGYTTYMNLLTDTRNWVTNDPGWKI